jgi:hypothetical protein
MNAYLPGAVKQGKAAVLNILRVRVYDSGPNNMYESGAGDDRLFLQQGLFTP